MMHAVSPPSDGLARRILSESGFPAAAPGAFWLQRSASFGEKFLQCPGASATAAERLACLRAAPLDAVLANDNLVGLQVEDRRPEHIDRPEVELALG